MAEKFDERTLRKLIDLIDRTPAVTWVGKGGVKERIQELIDSDESA